MPVAVALWSLEVKPGEDGIASFIPQSDLRITNVALGAELEDENARSTVKIHYKSLAAPSDDEDEDEEDEDDDEEEKEGGAQLVETVLASLTPGKVEQATADLILEEDVEVLFEVVGKNTIYLTGNYIDQTPPGVPFNDESDEEGDSDLDMEGYDLREVSSDVEINPDELDMLSDDDNRFEEVADDEPAAKPASKKRPRESDAIATDVDEEKLSKSQRKKLKKLKAEGGQAVTTAEETTPADTNGASGPEKAEKKGKKEKKEKKEKEKSDKGKEQELSGGIKTVDSKVGDGPKAKNGDTLSMRYIGKLQSGKVFDENKKGAPFRFRLGKGEVIKGWDIGIAGMQVGGERKVIVPPNMGYGSKKSGPIPPNSTLTFEVKLLKIN
ncbi:hypothetical protein EVJ58_g2850 [Rhodofomes roseus]|uniref:FK506-binding protein n=1 Tax=Rhodofomes roseus TaxID=34475 RepID=A0A4Y9YRC6_9APHY|nr:hypothetical protein EVJ58_g2850 [Rhodofomes roseus]